MTTYCQHGPLAITVWAPHLTGYPIMYIRYILFDANVKC